jgi:pyruvate-formate lyase
MEALINAAQKIKVSVTGEDNSNMKEEAGPSKTALKKAIKEVEKMKKKVEIAMRLIVEKAVIYQEVIDISQGKYGKISFIQSIS